MSQEKLIRLAQELLADETVELNENARQELKQAITEALFGGGVMPGGADATLFGVGGSNTASLPARNLIGPELWARFAAAALQAVIGLDLHKFGGEDRQRHSNTASDAAFHADALAHEYVARFMREVR